MDKERIEGYVSGIADLLTELSDRIFDFAEISTEEVQSAALLEEHFEKQGFTVERGIADLPTAFRAVWRNCPAGDGSIAAGTECTAAGTEGTGTGLRIGLLAEYDALPMGHGCGHHLQGPAILGAAMAVKELCGDLPCTLVVYGTPAEETLGGKILMQERGCFQDIDIALMMHGGPNTCVDVKCMALENFVVTFHGTESHAAIVPEKGRSAFDAVLLSFQGIEFLREHVPEDTRMHYTVRDAGGPPNVVPGTAVAEYTLRSYSTAGLKNIVKRFFKILDGAALMTETSYTYQRDPAFAAKIPVLSLNDLIMEKAHLFGAPQLAPPREKTGSTDFGNVMYELPGSCLRIAFTDPRAAAHSQEYIDAGKSAMAHKAVVLSAEILAAVCFELLEKPEKFAEIREEFRSRKAEMAEG